MIKLNINLLNLIKDTINKTKKLINSYNHTYPNQKYELEEILKSIFYILKSGISWRNNQSSIHWESLRRHFNILFQYKIFFKTYHKILGKYLKTKQKSKNKIIIMTDTSFIINRTGINQKRNKYCRNKKCTKLSSITDENGIPLNILIFDGNKNDITCFIKQINFIKKINPNNKLLSNKLILNKSMTHKLLLLADKGYDSRKLRNLLNILHLEHIIPYNKRNTKDENKIKHLSSEEKIKYKKRIKIEHSFSWIKRYKRIQEFNEKNIKIYESFLYFSLCSMLNNKIINNTIK